jgi:hypothetical protein
VEKIDRSRGCLFCGNEEGKFNSEEHIVPLASGNTPRSGLVEVALVIQPGSICNKCNSRRLSLRDQAFVSWPPVSAFRTLAQVRNRRGRLQDAAKGASWNIRFHPTDPNVFCLELDADTGSDSGREEVARALCKIALETRFLQNPADARSPRWDAVAAAAIGGPLPSTLAMGLKLPASNADLDLTIQSDVKVNPRSSSLQMALRLYALGLGFFLLLETPPPPPDPGTAWWVLGADGNLTGPPSMWGSFYGRADSVVRNPRGEEPLAKHSSRLESADPKLTMILQPSEGAKEDRLREDWPA